MNAITEPIELATFLRKAMEESPATVRAYHMVEVIMSSCFEDLADVPIAMGASLEMWLPLMEDLIRRSDVDGNDVLVSKPTAVFASWLLADMAARGQKGRIALPQIIMMMICALEWDHDFTLLLRKGTATLLSTSAFEARTGYVVRVAFDRAHAMDAHFSI